VAEWSCSGLQSRVRRFDSDLSLQVSNPYNCWKLISSGATASGITVSSGGEVVINGGSFSGTILSGGVEIFETVSSGVVVSGETISSPYSQTVLSGGILNRSVIWFARLTSWAICTLVIARMFNGQTSVVPVVFVLACVIALAYEMGYKNDLKNGRQVAFVVSYIVPFVLTTALALWLRR
jgi:hypothetical protein